MRFQYIAIALLLAPSLTSNGTRAQQTGLPEPIVQMTMDPPHVVVGQKTTLQIEVLAPNYMTAPPELPGFQLRNAVTRQLQSINRSEERNGTTYAGVRFQFAIYPLEPGSYAITGQTLTVRYAAEPPATRETTIALPRIELQAFIPDVAANLGPFLSATNLTIEHAIKASSEQLKVGDAVTRIITVKADGTPAMLLPAVTFPAIEGLAVYPAQPSLREKIDPRTNELSSMRVDSAVYMLERSGDFELPAIEVRWWNVGRQRIEVAHIDSLALRVAGNPAEHTAALTDERGLRENLNALADFIANHWRLATLTAIICAALAWAAPRVLRQIAAGHRRRRAAYHQSEAWWFARLRTAMRRRDARAVYFALISWLQRFASIAPVGTIDSLKAAARDPVLELQIDLLQTQLFTPKGAATDWSPRTLSRRISSARRTLRRQVTRAEAKQALPQQLNPIGDHGSPHSSWRRPAR